MKIYKKSYRILDAEVCLESDSQDFLNQFDADYGLFAKDASDDSHAPPSNPCAVSVMLDGNEKESAVSLNHEVFSLSGHPNKSKCAYQLILKEIFNQVREFVLLHAGVVAKDGNALILAGAPGLGKTTAVLELLKNGFSLYSDDFCPIHKRTGLVHPFPRSLWKVAGSANQIPLQKCNFCTPLSDGEISLSPRKNKIPLKPGELGYPVGNTPAKIGALICLEGEKPAADASYLLGIGLRDGEDKVISELEKLEGVAAKRTDNKFSDWCIRYPRQKGLTIRIREILEKHKPAIWNVFREDPATPDFSKMPVLTPIPAHEAAFRLIKDLKNEVIFKGEDNTTPASLMMMLCTFLNDVPCHRLSVGNLDATREILLDFSAEGANPLEK